MAKQTIYTVGGTVQAGGGVYIKRKADDELLELCRQGEFAFILSSRQVGKSSLMVHTAQELAADNICSVIIDLSALGTSITQEEWYLGILNEIQSSLNLETDIFGWWQQYSQLGPAQRLTNFFKDVLLAEVKEQVVLFFDEIDSTLSIPFSDDFYVALRAVYNARSTTPDFKRLSFVLVGVAAPSDLISDNRRTPFNIGRRVEIKDFSLAEALPLAQGLGQQAEKVLAWVLQYTGGHPYLTQRLCADLANSKQAIDEQTVASAVERLFTGEQGKQDNNLQFVRDMLSKRSPDVAKVLSIYRDVRSGKNVADDERSITKAHLKLSGLVRSEQGFLRVRNVIYNSVFNLQWVRENTPKNWQRTALIALSAILGLLVLGTLGVFINDFVVGSRIDRHYRSFFSPSSPPEQRLSDLAEIYRQSGILSHKDSNLTASQLFYGLSSAEEQRALFGIYNIQRFPTLENDLVIVISHLYITVANVDPEEDNTELLQVMLNALSSFPNNSIAASLKDEITAWIAGRQRFRNGDLDGALANYNNALSLNAGNQAVLYERAKVYVAREEYTNALNDLEATITAAKKSAPDIATATPTESPVPVLSTETPNSTVVPAKETSIPQTSLPTQNGSPATEVLAPTLELTPALTIEATATAATISPKRYESNFTTLIEVINAVRGVINTTPQLQLAIQSSDLREYINLSGYGLISDLPSQSGSSANSQPPADGRAWGIDISFFNKNIDWNKVKNAGVDFVFVKASQGDRTDLLFDSHWADAGQAGILRGAYHFIDPTVDCTTQAETFLSKVKLEPGDLPPVLDLEESVAIQNAQATQAPSIPNSQIISCAKTWLDKVEAETGRKPIIYSGYTFLPNRIRESNGQPPSWAMDYTLWIAYYPGHDLQANEPPIQVQGWPNWTFWQYSSRGLVDGVMNDDGTQPQGVDLNIFNGPLEELQTFLANSSLAQASTVEPPTVPPSSCDRAQFIAEVTVPDGTIMDPGASFTKTWRLKNVGSCTWTTAYQLVFFSGEQMGAPASQAFTQTVNVGQSVDISVNMTAPSAPGSYRGYWMFKDASGALFGTGPQGNRPWWVDIRVSGASAAATETPAASESPSSSVPVIETVNVNTHPAIPEELKEAFMIGPDSLDSSTTTNVIKFNGLTYWAYSYIDNRFSLGIVAYDSSNNIVKQWEERGARYLWKITVDSKGQTVVFHGQDSNTIVVKWSDLIP